MAASANIAPYPQLAGPFSLRQQYIGQPSRIRLGATQVVPGNSSAAQINLDTIVFDPYASSFNIPNNNFVAPATGYYLVNAQLHVLGSITTFRWHLCINGNVNEIFRIAQNDQLVAGQQNQTHGGGDCIFLNSGDTLGLYCVLSGASSFIAPATHSNFLSAVQIA